ncbi:SHC-transforming protein 3 isoform X2 [Coregonus clupeaformis]|uniref:SHC-transforming protein 3 isoform X2 n=1 Tax=Coregonus clupeaformis TaxID=59861 RepID=UPI001BE079C5|nr:SHC-transforming protein 3 isoform X2 [Coregonus clupeaformis]
MLHRTKYNRFRNESVTSVDDLHGLSMNPKVSAASASSAEPPYTPPAAPSEGGVNHHHHNPAADPSDDGATTLCTLINKVSNLKFTNSGSSLLGMKSLPSHVKDLTLSKLQGGGCSGGGSGGGSSGSGLASSVPLAASGSGSSGGGNGSSCGSASSVPHHHHPPCSHSHSSQQEPGTMSSAGGKKGSRLGLEEREAGQRHGHGGEDWGPSGGGGGGGGGNSNSGLVNKPCSRGWLHSSEKISGPGVTYIVKYLGCIEVLRSMKSLDFNTRSQITREAISLVCEAVPGAKGALRKRKPPSKALSSILGKRNLQFAGMSINLNISTSSLNLMTPDSKQIIANHHMQSISFASGGDPVSDPDTTDYVAYVAKDPVNRRACHILECSDGLAQDVISTIGQAFDLRFQQYLQCPSSKMTSVHDRVLNMDESVWTEEEEEPAEHPYYNNIPGKMPPPGGFIDTRLGQSSQTEQAPGAGVDQTYYQGRHCGEIWGADRRPTGILVQQGSCDIYSLPEGKSTVPKTGDVPTYVNTQQIDAQVLAALQAEQDSMAAEGAAGTAAKESPRKDLFDMKPFENAILTQSGVPALHKAGSVDNTSPLLVRSAAFKAQEELEGQAWYHGEMSRRDAEKLLLDDGDFLVRKSTTNPGSYVLTGMHNGLAKHLLLVNPEGTVRTKDHIFDSISHLIGHHRDNSLPIVSAGSELCLKQPVGNRKQ